MCVWLIKVKLGEVVRLLSEKRGPSLRHCRRAEISSIGLSEDGMLCAPSGEDGGCGSRESFVVCGDVTAVEKGRRGRLPSRLLSRLCEATCLDGTAPCYPMSNMKGRSRLLTSPYLFASKAAPLSITEKLVLYRLHIHSPLFSNLTFRQLIQSHPGRQTWEFI